MKKTASSQAKVKLTVADRRHFDMSAAVLKLKQELDIYKGVSKFQHGQFFQFRRDLERERHARKHSEGEVEVCDECLKHYIATHSARIEAVETMVLWQDHSYELPG